VAARADMTSRCAWILGFLSLLLAAPPSRAEEPDKTWSVSPLIGVLSPRLTGLNRGEFKSPTAGRGQIVFPETGQGQSFDFAFRNDLPDIRYGAEAGLQLSLLLDPVNKLFFGTSVWQSGSTHAIKAEMPFEGKLTPAGYERSARLSYFQYFMGWQHAWMAHPKKYSLHTSLSMHEVFDIDYKEDLVFGFEPTPGNTFKRIIVMNSHATGVLMFQLGAGGEYFLRDWISIGGDVGYWVGAKKFRLGNASGTTNIEPNDNLNLRLPVQPGADGKLNYLAKVNSFDDVTYRKLELGFDGWRAMMSVNLYF
jgi:hypothetical protein